jgi:hypothetical protein
MRFRKSGWTVVALGVAASVLLGTMVWASPAASPSAAPPQASPGFDADKVDGAHGAGSWWWPPSSRAYSVLWATVDGTLHPYALPQGWLNRTYVNDGAGEVGDGDVADGALSAAKIAGTAWTSTNDGEGSGLDADTVDGKHAAELSADLQGQVADLEARVRVLEAYHGRTKMVFVSSATYNGNLGGLSGADDKCQTLATGAGLPGSYKAWLSDTSVGPSTRFTHSAVPYILPDGTVVANDWADLTDGSLQHAINLTENLNPPVYEGTQTGTDTAGGPRWTNPIYMCANWTSASSDLFRYGGLNTQSDYTWTAVETGTGCPVDYHLYCFQQ